MTKVSRWQPKFKTLALLRTDSSVECSRCYHKRMRRIVKAVSSYSALVNDDTSENAVRERYHNELVKYIKQRDYLLMTQPRVTKLSRNQTFWTSWGSYFCYWKCSHTKPRFYERCTSATGANHELTIDWLCFAVGRLCRQINKRNWVLHRSCLFRQLVYGGRLAGLLKTV